LGAQQDAEDDIVAPEPSCSKKGVGTAACLKKAGVAKTAKKVSVTAKKAKGKAKKVPPPPPISDEDKEMAEAAAAEDNAAIDSAAPAARPAVGEDSLSYDFTHLARYLKKVHNPNFTKRNVRQQVFIKEKVERDLQRINYYIGERAARGIVLHKRAAAEHRSNLELVEIMTGGRRANDKGKGKASRVEDEVDEEEEASEIEGDDLSEGTLGFLPTFIFVHALFPIALFIPLHYIFRSFIAFHYSSYFYIAPVIIAIYSPAARVPHPNFSCANYSIPIPC
jgi:hypothetical protein